MTDAEILDKIQKIYRTARNLADRSAFIKQDAYDLTDELEKVLSQRQRGWKRTFKVKTPATR